jgi:hypothetical protein
VSLLLHEAFLGLKLCIECCKRGRHRQDSCGALYYIYVSRKVEGKPNFGGAAILG